MKKVLFLFSFVLVAFATEVIAENETTIANVRYIDERDTKYTQVVIDKATACGYKYFWINRDKLINPNYDQYMARVLTALVAGRELRINEGSSENCVSSNLYNPRVGIQ